MRQAKDYREILNRQFAERRDRNPGYSMRAFARDLGISPSRLSEVLSSSHRLSRPMAQKIGKRLGMDRRELGEFCDLADAEHPRSVAIRERARTRLARRGKHDPKRWQVLDDEVEMIASWHHLAILEVLATDVRRKSSLTRAEIATRLGLSPTEVGTSLERLKRLKLVRFTGDRVAKTARDFATTHDIPSDAVKRLHAGLLRRAEVALRTQTVEQRAFNSVVLAVPHDKLAEARQRLHDFARDFGEEMGAESGKDSVYCLGLQFFSLTTPLSASPDRPE